MKDKEFMASLNDTESDFEFVNKVKDELEKRGLGSQFKSFAEEISKEQNPENFGAIAEKYLNKGKEEPKVDDEDVDVETLKEECINSKPAREENVPGEPYKRYPLFMKKKADDELDAYTKDLEDYLDKNPDAKKKNYY